MESNGTKKNIVYTALFSGSTVSQSTAQSVCGYCRRKKTRRDCSLRVSGPRRWKKLEMEAPSLLRGHICREPAIIYMNVAAFFRNNERASKFSHLLEML